MPLPASTSSAEHVEAAASIAAAGLQVSSCCLLTEPSGEFDISQRHPMHHTLNNCTPVLRLTLLLVFPKYQATTCRKQLLHFLAASSNASNSATRALSCITSACKAASLLPAADGAGG